MSETGRYVEIPGGGTHELPPLLVRGASEHTDLEQIMASGIVEAEDMLPPFSGHGEDADQRKFELALQLAHMYRGVVSHWQWGDSILEWIRQCEMTFDFDSTLRALLHPDVWPHASRSSFVTLLQEKHVETGGIAVEKAVGLRLTFRQPPPIDCFSNHFLIFLNSPVADSAYQTWSHLGPNGAALLPPDRFHFEVVKLAS